MTFFKIQYFTLDHNDFNAFYSNYVNVCSVLLLPKHIGWQVGDPLPPLVHDQAIGVPLESTMCRKNGDSYAVCIVVINIEQFLLSAKALNLQAFTLIQS